MLLSQPPCLCFNLFCINTVTVKSVEFDNHVMKICYRDSFDLLIVDLSW